MEKLDRYEPEILYWGVDWKVISEFPKYLINKKGEIIRKEKIKYGKTPTILKLCVKKSGYCVVTLWLDNKKRKQVYIHRLVAQTFIPNPNNYKTVNHKDENKQNNCVENLEWCNQRYNNCYGTRLKRVAHNNKLKKKIKCYFSEGNEKIFSSINEASRKMKVPKISIYKSIKEKKNVGGLMWEIM